MNLELFTFAAMMLFGVIAPIGWTATTNILGDPLKSEVEDHPFFKHFVVEG